MNTAGKHALRGQTLSFAGDPFTGAPEESLRHESDGLVIIENGVIADVGPADVLLRDHPGVAVRRYADCLLMAGFVDAHVHYPQTEIIAAYGEQLLQWLNRYTFPAEARFADKEHADRMAGVFLDECLRNGITTSSVYCTVHPQSVDSLFEDATRRGMAMVAGKVMMDRNAPEALLETPQQSYDRSAELIERWHGTGRCRSAIPPPFAPTSSPEQLAAAGALWEKHPTALMQTHVSENLDEIAWVRDLYPDCRDYLDVYARHGLLKPGANFGHAIHLSDREVAAMRESGAGISHCPTSNTFIGSGLFPLQDLREGAGPVPLGLGTDVGGGSSFSMFDTMKSAYEIAQLRGHSLHPAKAYYLAGPGGAKLLNLEHKVGNLAPGFDADILVLDLNSRPLVRERMRYAEDFCDVLFLQMILADDRAVHAVYCGGSEVYTKE